MLERDTFCSYCGAKQTAAGYPKTCPSCKTQIWANPIPVSVALVPVIDGDRTGLLVVRRAIEPKLGLLGLTGGFLEEHESWQQGGAREVLEETGVKIDPASLKPLWWSSSEPKPNRVLLFGLATPIPLSALPAFHADKETSERGLVYGPDGLDEVFAFSTHITAALMYFASVGVTGPHGFQKR
ncbi:MAG TPA: NUDIX domain-containing protein [Kofleriaceae bacterium]|jgi:8-oxo-dGTP pyrophosphatase MutT (NUDIX family)